ncbi:MAG TPA: Fe-S cluster assembly protein SufD, partial [Nitrospinae bacterium]|nr:Fe-S cluster assembly protein SufD [Nitrospinota bacterium]
MSDTIAEPKEEIAFLDLHKKFVEENKSSSALSEIHELALSRFEMLGFPHSKHEMYTYVNTKKLAATAFAVSSPSAKIDLIEKHIY